MPVQLMARMGFERSLSFLNIVLPALLVNNFLLLAQGRDPQGVVAISAFVHKISWTFSLANGVIPFRRSSRLLVHRRERSNSDPDAPVPVSLLTCATRLLSLATAGLG